MSAGRDCYIIADNIYAPLANTTASNFEQLLKGESAVHVHNRPDLSEVPLAASLFNKDEFAEKEIYSKFEQLLIASVQEALNQTDIAVNSPRTGLIISSTKGNIALLEDHPYSAELQKRIALTTSADLVANYFGFVSKPVVISNACISGVMATVTAMRLIKSGLYDDIVVTGADVVSKFIVSGFQSFQALSATQCKPFDKDRTGLNLGEGAATVILSSNEKYRGSIRVTGGGISNDANHISGPSRTGEELAHAIKQAMHTAGLKPQGIDMISAHGTATPYNDEMEAKALTIAGLANAPLTGLKAVYGHTLGAAGLIEAIITAESMRRSIILPTAGFHETGTAPLNISTSITRTDIHNAVKTSSGFGGCNGVLILSK
ncbi:beta-ketoacyl-[acyl-carrier-protein] synthase family protein [Mucilaginibacter sp. KACC 22063]|uniref:beta-ketoacyl-[acyl-carrier-protein] synthase family protein n=1 Tax=Mucilaginibacter sp. KACC 22063 TaxID=3025666 RepID=UPI0023650088|nr:beta-ketoacyl synthase N-terminal-like domain-containing protein [Mucilaginibacter sp. KACC 22063]WDF55021.1 beta-ketoacyl synthase N-terminal-like domain-containing protein [Mucilaginibacter sp. KACC 22063]